MGAVDEDHVNVVVGVGDAAVVAAANEAAEVGVASDITGGIGAGYSYGTLVLPDQTADVRAGCAPGYSAGSIGIRDIAVEVTPDQAADVGADKTPVYSAGGIGVGDGAAAVVPNEAAFVVAVLGFDYYSIGIGVGDGAAGVPPDQSADVRALIDPFYNAGSVGIIGNITAVVVSDQTSYRASASYVDISQSNVAQRTAGRKCADETNAGVARLVHVEIVQCIAAAVQFTCRKYRNVPVRRCR